MADDADEVAGCDPVALVAGYEAMRAAVLSGHPEGWRHGHGVLASRGVAAWMATWAAVAPAPAAGTPAPEPSDPPIPSPSRPTDHNPAAPTLSSLRNAGEIVAVLAQMALAHL